MGWLIIGLIKDQVIHISLSPSIEIANPIPLIMYPL